VSLLTGSLGAAARRRVQEEIRSVTAGIVVGTHACSTRASTSPISAWSSSTKQHRFGVEQRDALRTKADQPPHVLVMTATPIPRTVAMTVFGDLETVGAQPAAARGVPRSPRTWCRSPRSPRSWTGPGGGCARRSGRATRRTSCARASAMRVRRRGRPAGRRRRAPASGRGARRRAAAGGGAAARAAHRRAARAAAGRREGRRDALLRRRAARRAGRDHRRSRSASTCRIRP